MLFVFLCLLASSGGLVPPLSALLKIFCMFVFLDFGLLYFCVFMTVIKFGEFGSTVVGSMLAQLSSGTDDIFVFLSFYIFVFLYFCVLCVFVCV